MPIFPRRVLQRMIDSGRAFLTEKRLLTISQDLDGDSKNVIPLEWELAVLSALSNFGKIHYEPDPKGQGTRPDLLFSLRPPLEGSFVGEITTVSDKFAQKEMAVEELSTDLSRMARKRGLNPNHFSLRILAARRNPLSNERIRVRVPKGPQFRSRVFTPEFHAYLRRVKSAPDEAAMFRVIADLAEVRIHYLPGQRFCRLTNPQYTAPTTLERNVVFRALKKKARQLRGSRRAGPFGIFLCDGGCEALRRSTGAPGITAEKIINRFLGGHELISFVQLFTVKKDWNTRSGVTNFWIEATLFEGQRFGHLNKQIQRVLGKLTTYLPEPQTTPKNAMLNQDRWPRRAGRSFTRMGVMQHNEAKLSGRVLLEYLAGRIDHEKFLADAGLSIGLDNAQVYNLFERWMKDGRLLSEIRLEQCPEKDDDWAILASSEPDAAISEFKARPKAKRS